MTRTNRDVVNAYFAAINSEDYDALPGLFHEDAVWRATAARSRRGRDDVVTYYPRALALFPEHYDDPTRFIEEADTIVVEITFTGKTPDGMPVMFEAIDVFDFEDGYIKGFSSWFDMDELRAQM
jgi:ketosteroid isomerase-like protein